MFKNYFKVAYRNLVRNKTNTSINVLGLSMGIAAALVIYTVLSYEMGFDAFHSKTGNTYRVVHHNHTADGTQYWNTTAYPLADALRQEFPESEITQISGPIQASISSSEGSDLLKFLEEKIWYVDSNFFKVFNYEKAFPSKQLWISGDPNNAFNEPNSIVLTVDAAKKYFKDEYDNPKNIIGKTLLFNDEKSLVVKGIVQNPPSNTNSPFEILLSYEFFKLNNSSQAESWEGNHQGITYMVLPENPELNSYHSQIALVKKKYLSKADNDRIEYQLQPLSEVHTESLYGASPGSYIISIRIIRGLVLLAALLILIALVNFINLATAQSLKRVKEIGIRKVMGGTRKQLFLQYMCESFLLTVFAFLCAFFFGKLALIEINKIIDFAQFGFTTDIQFILLGIVLILVITFLSGIYPALVMSGFSPIVAMKNNVLGKSRFGFSFRHVMIVFQFFIAQSLIAGTFIVASQMQFVRQKDLGYQKEHIISITLPNADSNKKELLRNKLLQWPGVQLVSFSSGAPTTHERQYGTSFRFPHEPLEMRRQGELKFVDSEYFALFQLKLIAGNIATNLNPQLSDGYVVNETLVNSLGVDPREAIGLEIMTNESKGPIIGVVQDFHNNALQEEIMPCLMTFWGGDFLDEANIQLSNNVDNHSSTIDFIHSSWREIFPDTDFSVVYVDENLTSYYKIENYLFQAFRIASCLAILIGCLGLYGLVSLISEQRTKEIGIRKLIGASIANIVKLLSLDFLKLILLAVGLATPVIYIIMNNWLQNFAYQIDLEWWYFVMASMVTLIIAFSTLCFKSIKSAMMNPVESLKYE